MIILSVKTVKWLFALDSSSSSGLNFGLNRVQNELFIEWRRNTCTRCAKRWAHALFRNTSRHECVWLHVSDSCGFYWSDRLCGSWFSQERLKLGNSMTPSWSGQWELATSTSKYEWLPVLWAWTVVSVSPPPLPALSLPPPLPRLSLYSPQALPSAHALPPLSASLCPLAHFPRWLGPESHKCFTRFAGKSLSQGLLSALPTSSFASLFCWLTLGTATHSSCGSPWATCCPTGSNSGSPWQWWKPGMKEILVVVGKAAEMWANLCWKLHQCLNHSQLGFTEK